MRSFLLCSTLLVAVPAVHAAEYINPWSEFWEILATDVGCSLQREFSNARAQEAGFHFGTEGATFDRFMIWIYIPSVSRREVGATYEKNKLYFSIYSQVYPTIGENQQRIDSVHVNDIELHRENTSKTTSFRQFVTEGKEAHEMLGLFESNIEVMLALGLSGGEVATLRVPSRSTERFSLWSKLLFTCASEIRNQQEQTNSTKNPGFSPTASGRKLPVKSPYSL